MQLFKFNLIFLLVMSLNAYGAFSVRECLLSDFDTKIVHKGKPFGLLKNILHVKKEKCVLSISHEKMKFMKKHWEIDVCRGPIHIKSGTGAIEVHKREVGCTTASKKPFCKEYHTIVSVIQDDGLIFAQGQKEKITDDHGKIHCSSMLIQSYLNNGKVYSLEEQAEDRPISSETFTPTSAPKAPKEASVLQPQVEAPVEQKSEDQKKDSFDF